MLLLAEHVPLVVNVTEYVLMALALKLISPVLLFTKTKPEGLELNVPEAPPVMVAEGLVPNGQYVPEE
jgi:hypothetical protein